MQPNVRRRALLGTPRAEYRVREVEADGCRSSARANVNGRACVTTMSITTQTECATHTHHPQSQEPPALLLESRRPTPYAPEDSI